jgi:tetratricopeptide (TPR) repeat protein
MKNRAKRQLAEQARKLAVEGKWADALEVNKELVERSPKDVDAFNRIGKANFELQRYQSAYAAYQEAVRLDPANVIAQRNLDRLEPLKEQEAEEGAVGDGPPILYGVFIEEVGKTYVDDLVNCAPGATLNVISSGDQLTLQIDGLTVSLFSPEGDFVGQLEPRIARRLVELIGLGNEYTVYVTSSTGTSVRVIVREVARAASMGERLSFPRQGKVAIPRAYLRDTRLFRGDEPELLLGDDEDDEGDGDDSEDFEAADLDDEAEYVEDAVTPPAEDEEEETL